jgi:hypothetical protein
MPYLGRDNEVSIHNPMGFEMPEINQCSAGYLVMRGEEQLYWGYSHHVARLLAFVMRAEVY